MRSYATDSPEAMARIVAAALMADGAIDPSEFRLIKRRDIAARLGFDHHCFNRVLHEFCDDMLAYSLRKPSGQQELASETIAQLLQEIRSPTLQQNLLRAILDIVHADNLLTGGEATLVSQAMNCWGLDLSQALEKPLPYRRRWSFQSRHAVGN